MPATGKFDIIVSMDKKPQEANDLYQKTTMLFQTKVYYFSKTSNCMGISKDIISNTDRKFSSWFYFIPCAKLLCESMALPKNSFASLLLC